MDFLLFVLAFAGAWFVTSFLGRICELITAWIDSKTREFRER